MLVLYLFLPAAAVVFLLMALASKQTVSTARTVIANHIAVYRIALMALAGVGCFASEILRITISCWLILGIPGAALLAISCGEFNSPVYLRFVFPFKTLQYVGRGLR